MRNSCAGNRKACMRVFRKHGIDSADLSTHGDTSAELHRLLKRRSRKRTR